MTLDGDTFDPREARALGRRDWYYFNRDERDPTKILSGEPRLPWVQNPITKRERFDRTIGIPNRDTTMWPEMTRRDAHDTIVDDLRNATVAPVAPVDVSSLVATLTQLAPAVYVESRAEQQQAIGLTARRCGMDAVELDRHAIGVGRMILKTSRVSTPFNGGMGSLHALSHSDLANAVEMYTARETLRDATRLSDPDLPRLWMLANAIHNGVPASTILAVPARAVSPLTPDGVDRDDLVGWDGVGGAIEQMHATVNASRVGRAWLTSHDRLDPKVLLGWLHLSHPRTAEELVLHGYNDEQLEYVVANLPTSPQRIGDISDAALKAMCDRNSWLLGTADERTTREVIERHIRHVATQPEARALLTLGDVRGFANAVALGAPTIDELEAHVWRHEPADPTVRDLKAMLNTASRDVVERFSGYKIEPRTNFADAIINRFPDRVARRGLQASSTHEVRREALSASPAHHLPSL